MKKLLIIFVLICTTLFGAKYKDWEYNPNYQGINSASLPKESTMGLEHMVTLGKPDDYSNIGFNWVFSYSDLYDMMISNKCDIYIYDNRKPNDGSNFYIKNFDEGHNAILGKINDRLMYVTIPYNTPGFNSIINILTQSTSFSISLWVNDGNGNDEELGTVTISSLGFVKAFEAWSDDVF